MRQNKYKINDVINNLLIIGKDKIVVTPSGCKKNILEM